MSKAVDRFLNYVQFDTQSDDDSVSVPSTAKQLELGKYIVKELKEIGITDAEMDKNGYIMASLPSNCDKEVPIIGLIAHMDTSPDVSGKDVKPQIIRNYDGKDILLNKEKEIHISPEEFPEIKDYIGQDIITTDGTTLLGADDKAGIAVIVTAVEHLVNNPQIKHGIVRIAFTPDEEIGRGTDYFDTEKFKVDFAYTIDGGQIGELEYENFNAAKATIKVTGKNIHPGYAKGKMKNAVLIGNEIVNLFPDKETPNNTEKYEGFYHLNSFKGNVEKTELTYLIRDFDNESFKNRKEFIQNVAESINKKYGKATVDLEIKDQYFNAKDRFKDDMHVVEIAKKAMENVGVTPIIKPIRGGTDGSNLSAKGILTPNIFAGGHNFHGIYEYVPIRSIEKCVDVVLEIFKLSSE